MAASSSAPSSSPPPPLLRDPWARRPVPLDAVFERGRFSPFWMGVTALITGFVLFQVLGTLFTIMLFQMQGVPLERLVSDPIGTQTANIREVLGANTLGQVFGLGLLALGAARLHSSRPLAFLRVRRTDIVLIVLSLIGLAALLPVVGWLGEINQSMPVPEWLEEFERMQMQMIEGVLASDLSLAFIIGVLALTPAICEELIFRGYVQRQFERSLGVVGSIVVTGLIFGLYHVRLTQVVPLSVLGIYLAYLTWRTGSLWPAVLAHFANNAYAAVSAQMASAEQQVPLTEVETMDLPWYIVGAALVVFAGVMGVLHRTARTVQPAASSEAALPEAPTEDAAA